MAQGDLAPLNEKKLQDKSQRLFFFDFFDFFS
jgi:hypothetical protein